MIRNRILGGALLLLAFSVSAVAQWLEPAAQLARQIAATTGPSAVSLTVRNLSSLTPGQAQEIKSELENQLSGAGAHIVNHGAAADVKLTLSENAKGYIWIAEIPQGAEKKIAMVTAPRLKDQAPTPKRPSVVIRKNELWTQEARILDVALLNGGSRMAVLDPAAVSVYKLSHDRWSLEQQLPIVHAGAWPRDLRGRLAPVRDHLFDAYLPGTVCANSAKPPLSLSCRAVDEPWPMAAGQQALYSAVRNFFSGAIVPGIGARTSVAAFYSAAGLPLGNSTLWVFARTDGSVHLMDGVHDVAVDAARGWGSDVAAIRSACGAGAQLLVTGAGDGESKDVVRAFEIGEREPAEVSAPAEFSGPVTALWSSPDGRSAMAVERDLKTGRYHAFELAITCGQ